MLYHQYSAVTKVISSFLEKGHFAITRGVEVDICIDGSKLYKNIHFVQKLCDLDVYTIDTSIKVIAVIFTRHAARRVTNVQYKIENIENE